MKSFVKGLSLLTASLLLPSASHAIQSSPFSLTKTEFVKPVQINTNNISHYISVSETSGITLFNQAKNVVDNMPRKAEHLDFRKVPGGNGTGVIATLDKNSGEVLIIGVDFNEKQLSLVASLPAKTTAYDALCLSANKNGVELFTVDVLGEVVHWSAFQVHQNTWSLREITRFPVGPNMKSCAVSDETESLYITEENIGVWRYPTNPEKEVVRQLIQLPKNLEVEYVDSTQEGDIAIVSPSINRLFLLNQETHALTHIPLDKSVAPKTVQLNRINNQLTAYMFDDESAQSIVKQIQHSPHLNMPLQAEVESLPAYAQTEPVVSYGDAADDPEIWVNQTNPAASLVYGTDKKHGLNVYDLTGKLITSLDVGRINNVDIRYQITVNNKVVDIAAASNRTTKSISIFSIDRTSGMPTLLSDIPTDLADPYGLCMSQKNEVLSVWINDTDGRFQQYPLIFSGGKVTSKKAQEWKVPSQPEGCVSDDGNQRLYYGEESTGIWLKQIDSNEQAQLIAGLNPDIEADIEGMSLYQLNNKQYLVVSSQGNNRYAVYDIDDNHQYIGAFKVGENWQNLIDGASETDGLAVTSHNLGDAFPNGLLVVQDGHNVMPKARQNFKLVNGYLLREWIERQLVNRQSNEVSD